MARLSTRGDDVVRTQAAWLVKEPHAADLAPHHAKVLVRGDRHVAVDVDATLRDTLKFRREVALDRVVANVIGSRRTATEGNDGAEENRSENRGTHVHIGDLVDITKVYVRVILAWCGIAT